MNREFKPNPNPIKHTKLCDKASGTQVTLENKNAPRKIMHCFFSVTMVASEPKREYFQSNEVAVYPSPFADHDELSGYK